MSWKTAYILAGALALGIAACQPVDEQTGARTATGAGVGAATGAAIGLISGKNFGSSVLTGAAVGAAGGLRCAIQDTQLGHRAVGDPGRLLAFDDDLAVCDLR